MLIDKVYKAVQLIASKDQSTGYVSPLDFNRYAELAQLDILTEKYNSVRTAGFGANYDREELYSELKSTTVLTLSSGSVAKPSDFLLYSVAYGYAILNGAGKLVPIDLVDDTEWVERLSSEIDAPTKTYPIMRMVGSNFNVEPTDMNQVHLTYIKLPLEPWWNYTASGKTLTFVENGGSTTNPNAGVTAGDSTDFTLTESEMTMLTWKICKYAGIQIREPEFYQMIEAENVSDE